ncbi:AEC family transporter [Argonema antarcticum]|uniref:AEC family transporter n=1 Tax=Argonema antarcticum TaxID=2942763 RepID=UPI002011F27E|nr:AEC family transporter [Argonema antarcticum]MCL1469436.1 AEC family transporter [Argonema antarcticum A004/B2]
MSSPEIKLLELYMPIAGGVLLGWFLGYILPKSVPAYLGQFLFWIGVPISIVAFLRRTNLSGPIWIAPVAGWAAILLGAGLAWAGIKIRAYFQSNVGVEIDREEQNQGSFLLASMVGNTGYLGYPVTLALVGQEYFGWAVFYDLLGSTLGTYGLGVALAARFGTGAHSFGQLLGAVVKTPALWSLGFGLAFRLLPLPDVVDTSLQWFAWTIIALSLILIGMRLSQLSSWGSVRQASISLGIKMLLVPLVLGYGLRSLGVTGLPLLVILLQMAMPPAFATLIIAEAYNLDRDLAVTAIALGTALLFFTLPIWLWLFGV